MNTEIHVSSREFVDMLGSTELSPEDRLFWEIAARYPSRPMICTFYFELSGPPARSRLQALVDAACAAHPRLTWRLEAERGRPRWRSQGAPAVMWSVDPELRSHGARCAWLAAQSASPLPGSGPSWSLEVLSERPESDPGRGSFGLLLRWHHALSDAEGVLDLLVAMAKTAPGRPLADPSFTAGHVGSEASPRPARRGLAALRQRLRGGARSSSPGGAPSEVCSPTLRLDFAGAAAIAAAVGVTVEDVLNVLSARAIAR
ncbi:MAG: hypothetical protein KC486_32435, partial [Myxococcales bacterium]|nr:hypothetical protein [Myxococcales bacterium]